jgi:protein TonB
MGAPMQALGQHAAHPIYAAVALSAALHLSLIYAIAPRPRAIARPIPPLAARLISEPVLAPATPPGRRLVPQPPQRTTAAEPLPIRMPVAVPETPLVAQSAANGTETVAYREDSALPKADVPMLVDQQWYEAHDLDTYPRPLAPIDTSYASTVEGTGSVTLMVSIDETGVVRDAAIVSAEPEEAFEAAALNAARAARFVPARKEGREVRSKVIVKLRFAQQSQ